MPVTEQDLRDAAATIGLWPQYAEGPPAADGGIPGLLSAELRVLVSAAARFCRQHPIPARAQSAALRELFALARPARPGAAGLSSPVRDQYRKDQDRMHFMLMLPGGREAAGAH